jgi:uncharacterized protein (DUF488 family)
MNIKSNVYVWTLGHGAKPLDVFLNKLKEYKIDLVVDARTYPISRFHPHYSKMPLQRALTKETIKYLGEVKTLVDVSLTRITRKQ